MRRSDHLRNAPVDLVDFMRLRRRRIESSNMFNTGNALFATGESGFPDAPSDLPGIGRPLSTREASEKVFTTNIEAYFDDILALEG